jgi:hypothetical protein
MLLLIGAELGRPRDRDAPPAMLSPSERRKLPAPPIGKSKQNKYFYYFYFLIILILIMIFLLLK